MKLTLKQRREHMVKDQICARGITDEKVINAMLRVPRHLFLPAECEDVAYGDHPVSIGYEQTISQPYMVGSMTALLELEESHKVLEIGTGSGYQTAILCEIAREIHTVERIPQLSDIAADYLDQAGYNNFNTYIDDGTLGLPDEAPFDRIIVTAASPHIPESLVQQLGPGGVMIIPSGENELQYLYKVRKTAFGIKKDKLYGCRFVKLIGKEGWR